MAKARKAAPKRKPKQKEILTDTLLNAAIEGIREKKGHEIVCLDLRKTGSSVADYFLVCHGDSHIQVDAIADSVDETVYKKTKEAPLHKEGFENADWVILDYFNVVVHIFNKEVREYYRIERLWGDARIEKVAGT